MEGITRGCQGGALPTQQRCEYLGGGQTADLQAETDRAHAVDGAGLQAALAWAQPGGAATEVGAIGETGWSKSRAWREDASVANPHQACFSLPTLGIRLPGTIATLSTSFSPLWSDALHPGPHTPQPFRSPCASARSFPRPARCAPPPWAGTSGSLTRCRFPVGDSRSGGGGHICTSGTCQS